MRKLTISLINFYQLFLSFDGGLLSYFAPTGACKFEVSCSEYTKRAIRQWGIFKGLNLGFRRILVCR